MNILIFCSLFQKFVDVRLSRAYFTSLHFLWKKFDLKWTIITKEYTTLNNYQISKLTGFKQGLGDISDWLKWMTKYRFLISRSFIQNFRVSFFFDWLIFYLLLKLLHLKYIRNKSILVWNTIFNNTNLTFVGMYHVLSCFVCAHFCSVIEIKSV